MGYGLIPLVASIALGIHHVLVTDASTRSKASVSVIVITSLVIWFGFPKWMVWATVLQSSVGVYLKVQNPGPL